MTSRHLPLVGAAALVGLALLLALLARDIRAWNETIPEADRAFQVRPGAAVWEPDGLAIGGLSRALLGLDEDLRLREAAQTFRRSRPRAGLERRPKELSLGTSAQVAFGALQRGDHAVEIRSSAANELGILALADALADPTQAQTLSKRAVQKFTEAITLDPANEEARFNLELVLTLLDTGDSRLKSLDEQSGSGPSAGSGGGTGGSGL